MGAVPKALAILDLACMFFRMINGDCNMLGSISGSPIHGNYNFCLENTSEVKIVENQVEDNCRIDWEPG